MTVRGWAWGEENSNPETPEVWNYWTEKGTIVTARNDGPWGKLQLLPGEEFVSPVKDLGSAATRFLTIETDKYSTGKGSGTIYWRGSSSYFTQDSNESDGPVWELYNTGSTKTWRYIQIRVVG